jgi:hypothetical protein
MNSGLDRPGFKPALALEIFEQADEGSLLNQFQCAFPIVVFVAEIARV